jgi:hypothetical protein
MIHEEAIQVLKAKAQEYAKKSEQCAGIPGFRQFAPQWTDLAKSLQPSIDLLKERQSEEINKEKT